MPKSFRLDPELERQLEEAAHIEGKPTSALIRDAVRAHCQKVLRRDPRVQLQNVIGVIESDGGRANQTGEAFKELLNEAKR